MRKFVFPVLILLMIVLGAVWFFMSRQTQAYSENSAFRAIPLQTPLVVEVPEIKSLVKTLKGDNALMAELQAIPQLQSFWKDVDGVKMLLEDNDALRQVVADKSLLVAFNSEGKSNIGCLFAFSLDNRAERKGLIDCFEGMAQNGKATLTKRSYDHVEVYRFRSGADEFHFAEDQGIFLFSRYALFVEEAVRQISAESLLDQGQFKDLYNTVGSSSDFNLFINHARFGQLVSKIVAPDFRKLLTKIAHFADWTELDVTLDDSEFLMGGFSFSDPLNDNYLNIFRRQEAGRFRMDEVLTSNTSLFVNLNVADFNAFQSDFEEFLKKQGSYYSRETKLKELERYCKKPFISFFEEMAGDEYALAYGQVAQNEPVANRFFIARVKSQSVAREMLLPMIENYARANKKTLEQVQSKYQIQQDQVFDMYEFPFANLPELLFGQVFSAAQSNYLCFYDNCLIFADNLPALKNYVHDLALSSTLAKDISFQKFNQQMASRSSLYFYQNFSRLFNLKNYYFTEDVAKTIQENEVAVRKFYALGWQFSANSGGFLNNLYLKYDPVLKEEPQTVWQSKLDTTISVKPQMVINHNDKDNKEVVVQDHKNNLYLLNKEGICLWKVKLSGKILGDVFQVDYYRNGKLQYLFNTAERLYLIDRNGNNVAKFPVNFRSPATNGVAVFDYDNNRNYRFFVACENKQIYAYDRDGKIVTGWKAEKTDAPVINPLKFFRLAGKDYLVCADRFKTYILDRQGSIRVKTTDNFEHSGNDLYLTEGANPALATTDVKGLVHLQYFDGKSATLDLGNFGAGHFFVADDLNADGKTDYIVADENRLYAFTDQGKKLFDRKFNASISGKPNVYAFAANNKKIGVVCRDENRVYLINSSGDLYEGFPLQGNTDFSIGFLSKGNTYFNLLVGSEDNSLFNYRVE